MNFQYKPGIRWGRIAALVFIVAFAATLAFAAVTATVEVTFTHDPVDPAVTYVVEENRAGVWTEVGSGASSPITYTRSLGYGAYEVRVFWRMAGVPRDAFPDTSTSAKTVITPATPANPAVKRK